MENMSVAIKHIDSEIQEYKDIIAEAEERISDLVRARNVLLRYTGNESDNDVVSVVHGVNKTASSKRNSWGRNIVNSTVRNVISSMRGEIPVNAVADKCSVLLKGEVKNGSVGSVMRKMVKEGVLERVRVGVYRHVRHK